MPRGEIGKMAVGCGVIGLLFAAGSLVVVPPLYDISLAGFEQLAWIFGVYVAARGIRFLIKAVCNAAGLHTVLMLSNYLVLAVGVLLIGGAILLNGSAVSITMIAVMITVAHVCRFPVLLKILRGGFDSRQPAGIGVGRDR